MSRSTSEEPSSPATEQVASEPSASLFRQRAIDDSYRGVNHLGRRLRLSSRWLRWPFRLLMAVMVSGLVFAIFGQLNDYVGGPAMVRVGQPAGPCGLVKAPAVVVMLAAQHLPRLQRGMTLRLRLDGFPQAAVETVVAAVGDEILGPHSARRLLGERLAGSMKLDGTVIPLCGRLPNAGFDSAGQRHLFRDGMQGTAEVRTGSQRLIFALLPGLESFFDGGRGGGDG